MRLTLRTLLAYLDNTLDPQDAVVLRQKLTESGFATQLVQRIQDSLTSSLAAPSPEAVGPVEEANVISEYLDSTLPAEQVAEIERACLESGPHLAEAAACHQILTMVLGKSAVVPHDLRKRIYELPDRKLEDIAKAASFSGVSIPIDSPTPLDAKADDIPTAASTAMPTGEPVKPVGVNDSGVSDAPTRLRQAEAAAVDQAAKSGGHAGLAGSKARSIDDSRIYGGSIRPSRIAPWLVSLALVAALGFAMVRIFEPLWSGKDQELAQLNDPVELVDEDDLDARDREATTGETPIDDVTDDAPPPLGNVTPRTVDGTGDGAADGAVDGAVDSSVEGAMDTDDVELVPPPEPLTTPESTPEVEDTVAVAELPMPEGTIEANGEAVPGTEAVVEVTPPKERDVFEDVAPPPPAPTGDVGRSEMNDVAEDLAPPLPPSVEEVTEDADQPNPAGMATLATENTLVAARVGATWEHLKKDDVINAGLPVLCAPTFRAEMVSPGLTVTMVGPAEIVWDNRDAKNPVMQINYGRLIVTSTESGAELHLRFKDKPTSLRFADTGSVVAISLQQYRAPGFDPLAPENRRMLAGVLAVQGSAELLFEGSTENLAAGQQWTKRGTATPQVTAVEEAPTWIDPTDEDPLVKEAKEGLLALIEDEQPMEIELREARSFRRAEVGALAGRTLLYMGYGDVYFGGDGILSDPRQRSYWSEHYDALQAVINVSADAAANLRAAIIKMDSANAVPLFRLLTGYSQNQLVEGGDEELVKLLDSASMAVRVLALENLEAITGTTLYFRPEQDNAVRREAGIKKWIARQRKGDIRWQQ